MTEPSPLNPNPTPAAPVMRPSLVDRKVLCRHYDSCLDYCLAAGWESFACGSCTVFEMKAADDPDYWAEQGDKARMLWYAAGVIPKSIRESAKRHLKALEAG